MPISDLAQPHPEKYDWGQVRLSFPPGWGLKRHAAQACYPSSAKYY